MAHQFEDRDLTLVLPMGFGNNIVIIRTRSTYLVIITSDSIWCWIFVLQCLVRWDGTLKAQIHFRILAIVLEVLLNNFYQNFWDCLEQPQPLWLKLEESQGINHHIYFSMTFYVELPCQKRPLHNASPGHTQCSARRLSWRQEKAKYRDRIHVCSTDSGE